MNSWEPTWGGWRRWLKVFRPHSLWPLYEMLPKACHVSMLLSSKFICWVPWWRRWAFERQVDLEKIMRWKLRMGFMFLSSPAGQGSWVIGWGHTQEVIIWSLEEPHQEPSILAWACFLFCFVLALLEMGAWVSSILSKLSPTSSASWAQTLNPPQLWATTARQYYLFYESHPIYDILLQKPELIKPGLITHSIHSMLQTVLASFVFKYALGAVEHWGF